MFLRYLKSELKSLKLFSQLSTESIFDILSRKITQIRSIIAARHQFLAVSPIFSKSWIVRNDQQRDLETVSVKAVIKI